MQIAAHDLLKDVVKHFLVLENEQVLRLPHHLSPDGHAGIVFCYRERFTHNADTLLPVSFIYGQISRFHELIAGGSTGMLVVVLQPYALFMLTGIPAHELTDQLISLHDIFGKAGRQLEEQILTAANNNSRLRLVEDFLVGRLHPHIAANGTIQQALHAVYNSNGCMQIVQLTDTLHTTERQLERMFRDHIGLSPKQFLRTIRFRSLLRAMQQPAGATLTQLAYNAGYYDQPHFNREFKIFTGITPKQYMTQTRLLALNFMQLV